MTTTTRNNASRLQFDRSPCDSVGPIEALVRYLEADQPYKDAEYIYPNLFKISKLAHLSKHKRIDYGNSRFIYHARERRYVDKYGIEPESGHISCSTKKGCVSFSCAFDDPKYFKVDLSKVDWYVHVPTVVHRLLVQGKNEENVNVYERLECYFDRIESENEYIVPYREGLLIPLDRRLYW